MTKAEIADKHPGWNNVRDPGDLVSILSARELADDSMRLISRGEFVRSGFLSGVVDGLKGKRSDHVSTEFATPYVTAYNEGFDSVTAARSKLGI